MLTLKTMSLEDITEIRPYLEGRTSRSCDDTPADMIMWREWFDKSWAVVDDSLVVHLKGYDEGPGYMVPLGGSDASRRAALEAIVATSREQGEPLRFIAVPEADLAWLQALQEEGLLKGELDIHTEPAWWDYMYTAEDLVTLSGRKYATQRNHINKFMRDYPMMTYGPITEENLPKVQAFFEKHVDAYQKDDPILAEERKRIAEIFQHQDLYEPLTGCLMLGEYVVGFTIGEVLGDTLFSHVEKASMELAGAYPVLTQNFNREVAERFPQIAYINREEDMGDAGLQQAKESYHPVEMVKKYLVTVRD